MNKLIKHRFWILLALVPPLVVFGYYSANGAIKKATLARESELDTSFKGIPTSPGPNETYFKADKGGLEVFNKQLRTAVDIEMVRVWAQQVPRMKWPSEMVDNGYVPDTYRGEFSRDAVSIYKDGYEKQLQDLWLSLEPLRPGPSGSVTGKVRYDRAQLPQYFFGPLSAPSERIWNAQEDIWLLQLLFDAIRSTNRPADNAAKAPVRWLTSLTLMGGSGESTVRGSGRPGGGAAVPGFGGGGKGNYQEDDDDVFSGYSPTMAGGGQSSVAFNPAEEFGEATQRTTGPGGAQGAVTGVGGNRIADDDEEYIIPTGGRFPGRPGAMGSMMDENQMRYIGEDKNKNAKFQERGFYMSVLIDQNKIADFLVELANSDWPIQIVRFNVGPNPNAGMRGMGGMGGGMYSGGRGNRQADTDGSALRGGGLGFGSASTMNSMLSAMEDEDGDMMSAPGFSNPLLQGGMGQAGGGIGPASILTADQIGNLFSHPDLVELHLCGKITMYKPPSQDLLASVQAAAAAGNADAREVVELMGLPVTELAAGATPAEGAGDAAESTDASTEDGATETSPADSAASAADEAATAPTAEEPGTPEEPAAEAAAEG